MSKVVKVLIHMDTGILLTEDDWEQLKRDGTMKDFFREWCWKAAGDRNQKVGIRYSAIFSKVQDPGRLQKPSGISELSKEGDK